MVGDWQHYGTVPAVIRRSKLQLAAALLGLADALITTDAVKAAYRSAVKAAHPDTATDPGAVKASMSDLQEARDVLLAAAASGVNQPADSKNQVCFLCKGSGSVQNGFIAEPCVACGGSGVAK